MLYLYGMEKEDWIGLAYLQERVKDSISEAFPDLVWVRAEISEVKNHPSGHCYLTLIEKDEDGNYIKAKASAIIWASTFRLLRPYFETTTGASLSIGMNILVRAQVQYSELYGMSLVVTDIDPSFTVGGLEIERQKTIARLKDEGMFDMNRSLSLAKIPRRFAVISSETAAGYRDFMKQLHENEYGYSFETELFPALMQGTDCPVSIIEALENVASDVERFDAVLILRGGGGATDLVCFDDYDLAANVAQFPLPVLTGIGHDHDYHVIDMVAYCNVKTPTALADFIIDLHSQEEYCLQSLVTRLQLSLKSKIHAQESVLQQFKVRLRNAIGMKTLVALTKLDQMEHAINSVNPQVLLKKGYTLVLKNGRIVDSINDINEHDEIKVLLKDGGVEAQVTRVEKNRDEKE